MGLFNEVLQAGFENTSGLPSTWSPMHNGDMAPILIALDVLEECGYMVDDCPFLKAMRSYHILLNWLAEQEGEYQYSVAFFPTREVVRYTVDPETYAQLSHVERVKPYNDSLALRMVGRESMQTELRVVVELPENPDTWAVLTISRITTRHARESFNTVPFGFGKRWWEEAKVHTSTASFGALGANNDALPFLVRCAEEITEDKWDENYDG